MVLMLTKYECVRILCLGDLSPGIKLAANVLIRLGNRALSPIGSGRLVIVIEAYTPNPFIIAIRRRLPSCPLRLTHNASI